jgi:hypothetical protein
MTRRLNSCREGALPGAAPVPTAQLPCSVARAISLRTGRVAQVLLAHLVRRTQLRLKLVADIPHRTEVPWIGWVYLYFLTQP